MQPKVVFLPSFDGDSNQNFYRQVGSELEKLGFQSIYLDLKSKDNEDGKIWLDELKTLEGVLDENTFLVSHSISSLAVARFLQNFEGKIGFWHIVGSGLDVEKINSQNSSELIKLGNNWQVQSLDWGLLESVCESITLHFSQDDTVVDFAQGLEWREKLPSSLLLKYPSYGHFKTSDFPELTKFIATQWKNTFSQVDGQKMRIKITKNEDLPLILPEIKDYLPTNDGKSPLAKTDWKDIKNENGEIVGNRETDTMPNWAGSSWYYLRYIDPKNDKAFADPEKLKYWLPVDRYYGGGEHTTLHLLYSRFWHRFLYDISMVPTKEPYQNRINGGILLGPDGQKMSKSKGNVVGIQEKLKEYGADAVRLYIAFIGPYDSTVIWNEGGLRACKRLVDNIVGLQSKVTRYMLNTNLAETTNPTQASILTKKVSKNELETKYLIFDFDGVLADTFEIVSKVRAEVKNTSINNGKDEIRNFLKNVNHGKNHTLSQDEIEAKKQGILELNKASLKYEFSLFDGFIEQIKQAELGYNLKLAVVSSASKEFILDPALAKTDIEFTHILGIEDHHSKEEKIVQICKDWQINAKEVFYFTDTTGDVLELQNYLDPNKILGCSWGWHGGDELAKILPKHQILGNFADFGTHLENWLSPKGLNSEVLTGYHKFIQSITSSVWENKNNVAVAEIMTFVNLLKQVDEIPMFIWAGFLQSISPFAPFISEELWYKLHNFDENESKFSIHLTFYPQANPELCLEDKVTVAVQVNGKLRATLEIPKDLPQDQVLELAKKEAEKWLEDKPLKFSKVIPNKIVSLVV